MRCSANLLAWHTARALLAAVALAIIGMVAIPTFWGTRLRVAFPR